MYFPLMKTVEPSDAAPTKLQRTLAARIVAHARAERLRSGDRVRESRLAKTFSVSRTPVRAALDHLAELGFVEHVAQRGYLLKSDASALPDLHEADDRPAATDIYKALIEGYFRGDLPERVSEAALARRLKADRAPLQEALARLSVEGIIRPNPGYGWQFEPLLRTREADEESYRFRLMVEPAAIREPTFRADPDALSKERDAQMALIHRVRSGRVPGIDEVFDINARFHELLADFSGNRFVRQTIEQQSRLRRLLEYRNFDDPERAVRSGSEHVEIIDALLAGRRAAAANLMHRHIASALDHAPAFRD
mgnify:CR=1 FL=1